MKFLLSAYSKFIINYPVAIFITIAVLTLAALILQYVFGFLPCTLCKLQRIPYYFILVLGLFNFASKRRCEATYVKMVILVLAVTAMLAFYHAGVEYGVFENVFNCVAGASNFNNIAELQGHLTNKISVPCDKPVFKFIFTLSGWNFFIAITLGFFGIIHILLRKR